MIEDRCVLLSWDAVLGERFFGSWIFLHHTVRDKIVGKNTRAIFFLHAIFVFHSFTHFYLVYIETRELQVPQSFYGFAAAT